MRKFLNQSLLLNTVFHALKRVHENLNSDNLNSLKKLLKNHNSKIKICFNKFKICF